MDEKTFQDFILDAQILLYKNNMTKYKKDLEEQIQFFENKETYYIDCKCDMLSKKIGLIEMIKNPLFQEMTDDVKNETLEILRETDKFINELEEHINKINSNMHKVKKCLIDISFMQKQSS